MLSRLVRLATAGALTLGISGIGAATAAAQPVAANGSAVNLVASGLNTPTSFAFGDGAVFEGDGGGSTPDGGVFLLKGGTGTLLSGSPQFVAGLAWHHGALYVSGGSISASGATWQLQRWSGWNGSSFANQQVIYTAPAGFDGFNGIAFGANGRLYVGVDVGITDNNDHGPATTSPYLYDILTFWPDGSDMRVFATGMRQPWQLAFLPGSNDPFVSDLGQDSGATNPLDALLLVRPGQNYGFPDNPFGSGYAQPFETFPAHTDVMGVAIFGPRIYLSEFGANAPAQPPQVVSIPVWGGAPQTVVSGFDAPIVGLGIHHGQLYIGETTGDVYSVQLAACRKAGWWGKRHHHRWWGH